LIPTAFCAILAVNKKPKSCDLFTAEDPMSKARDTKKEVKKKPSKSLKEKRKEKQEKKKGLLG